MQLTEVRGTGMEFLQKPQNFRERYGSLAGFKEVPNRYMNIVPVPVPAPGYFSKGMLVPRVWCHGRTERTEVPVRDLSRKIPGILFSIYATEHNLTKIFRKPLIREKQL